MVDAEEEFEAQRRKCKQLEARLAELESQPHTVDMGNSTVQEIMVEMEAPRPVPRVIDTYCIIVLTWYGIEMC